MPWSDWQQEDYQLAPDVLQITFDVQHGTFSSGSATAVSIFNLRVKAHRMYYPPDPASNMDVEGGSFNQFSAPSGWAEYRPTRGDNWWPDPLDGLTRGVDFDLAPGRSESDLDAFVQYEDGPSVQRPWSTFGLARFQGVINSGPSPASFLWQFGVAVGTTFTPGPISAQPDVGTIFAEGPGTTASGTPIASPDALLPAPSTTPVSFTITGRIPAGSIVTTIDDLADVSATAVVTPWFMVRPPRWRYWIPGGPPPLRLRQRDDNLFLNAGRIRNRSSRQTTNRLRSYD